MTHASRHIQRGRSHGALLLAAVAASAVLAIGASRPIVRGDTPPADAPSGTISLAIYNSGTGLVEDTRTLRLDAGEQEIRWPGIPQSIDASSVHLLHTGGDIALLQQAYRFDLAESFRALQLLRGKTVVVFTAQGKRYEGTLWAWDGQSLTLATDTGLVMIQQSQIASVETPVPERALTTTPTLTWRLWAKRGGEQKVTAAYLTGGLTWHAEYVLEVDEKMTRGSLSSAASVENTSGVDFREAAVHLVAGDVNRGRHPGPIPYDAMLSEGGVARSMSKAPSQMEETGLSEYHMYTLSNPVTVLDRETRQVAMFNDASVTVRRSYRFEPARGSAIQTRTRPAGIGMPSPLALSLVTSRRVWMALPRAGSNR